MKNILVLIVLSFLVLTACNPNFYIPNTLNVPGISSKGEVSGTVSGNTNQIELQGAYGLSDKFAVQLNSGLFIPADLDNGNGGSGKFIEGGIGYFKNIGKNLLFDTYGLIGTGFVENHMPSTVTSNPGTTGDISANLLRIGIQPSLSYVTKYFSVAGSFRAANLNYSGIKGNLLYENQLQVNYLHDNKSNFLIEPALTLKGGFEKIKLQVQFVKSLNISNAKFRQDNELLTLGLNFRF